MRNFVSITICALFVFAAGAAYAWWEKKEAPLLRIGISPWPGYEFLYLAEKKGFFKEEGLNVQIKQFSSPEEDVRNAFERGQIEAMCNTITDMLQAYVHTGKVSKIVLVADYSDGADVILARAPAHNVKDLKGKNIAVEPMSLGMVMLARAAEMEGMEIEDFHLLNFSQNEMKKALETNKVDAVVTYPPMSLDMQGMAGMNVVFDSTRIPGEIVDIVAVDSVFLEKNPETVPALRRVWARALAFAEENPDEAYGIMAAREGISAEEFGESLEGIYIVPEGQQAEIFSDQGALEKAISTTADTLKEAGALEADIGDVRNFIFMP